MKKTLLIVCGLLLIQIASAGEKDYRTEPRQWGTMYVHPEKKHDFIDGLIQLPCDLINAIFSILK
jgi:hypothetical protein